MFFAGCKNEDHGTARVGIIFSLDVDLATRRVGLLDDSTRVAPSFYLGCVAAKRPSNWLLRRFYRARLSRPLETTQGDPAGRTATSEGGRTAPRLSVSSVGVVLLGVRFRSFYIAFVLYLASTRAEDRATVGTDPSADPGAKTEGRAVRDRAAQPSLRDWHQGDKSRGFGGWPPIKKYCFFRFLLPMPTSLSIGCHASCRQRSARE